VPQWVIDEAAGRGQAPETWRAGPPVLPGGAPVRRRGRNARRKRVRVAGGRRARPIAAGPIGSGPAARSWTGWSAAVLVLGAVVGATWLVESGRLAPVLAELGVPGPSPAVARNPYAPPPGAGAAAAPLGAPAPTTETGTSFAFVALQDDRVTPVAYDPCRQIHYVTRPDGAPADGQQMITDAVARVSLATGLQFVDDGTTTEPPSSRRDSYQPDRYGDRWAPVLFSWSTTEENAELAGYVAGVAGSAVLEPESGPAVFVTGQVILDAPQLAEVTARPDGPAIARSIVLHEVAHLVGLGHVEDTTQVMFPEAQVGVTELGSGDLTGLAALGRGACVPQV